MKTPASVLLALAGLSSTMAITAPLLAQDKQPLPSLAVKATDIYKPTAMPDRIVLSWSDHPLHSQAVSWRTSVSVKVALAEIAIAEADPKFTKQAKQWKAESQELTTDLSTAMFHSVTFTELQPATKYAYRLGDGTNWTEWFHFKTPSTSPEPFSFVYFGDAQNDIRSLWSRVIREAYGDAPKAAFMLHAGDLINSAERDADWGEWFGAGGWLNAMVPSIAVPGNHEQAKQLGGGSRLSHHWRPQFSFPLNGPKGLEESCFTLVYHNMLLVCMNSNEQLELQAEWLDKVLAENKSPWVVCCFHHPIFSTAKNRDNSRLRALWKPILDKYKVDLVLQGHDHSYGRTGLDVPDQVANQPNEPTAVNVPTGAQTVDPRNGTVYVVSVSGPKMYAVNRQPFMKRVAENTQLYQVIRIDGDKLHFEARTAIGQLYDAFELRKRDNQVNELIEIDPKFEQQTPTTPVP